MILWYFIALIALTQGSLNSVWRWECERGYCQKKPIGPDDEQSALSLAACQISCSNYSALWPYPTGSMHVSRSFIKININSVDLMSINSEKRSANLFKGAAQIFQNSLKNLVSSKKSFPKGGKSLVIDFKITNEDLVDLTLDTPESYVLKVEDQVDGRVHALITADNFYGARHALETLSQLTIYDDLRDELQLPKEVSIEDRPVYPYRGILMDTSRNFVEETTIKRTLDAMGASKMNRLHWHITDSHSFPYKSASHPELTKWGAYSPQKVYENPAEIVEYGRLRGVRVVPEFDAPAHVGEGWQDSGLVTCLNWQPWQDYCVEPPCGQFDPTQDKLYDVLEGLYGDMLKDFTPDIFHMGGDEVNFNCWNSTENIVAWMSKQGWGRTEADFIKLWNVFQSKALERLNKKAGKQIPVIMWTSTLTQIEYVLKSLPKEHYIIQIWTLANDTQVTNLLNNGYKLILSNYDAMYLDCGFGGWVTDGNNWCSPYIGWQKVYENKPQKIAGSKKNQILGSEATLWAEQVDSTGMDSRLWPRAAAMAEVYWSEPSTTWRDAEQRILVHRQRLVAKGIQADALEPEWCRQNEENCPIGGHFNVHNF